MSSIPLINIVAVAHLFCIAALSGCMAAEVVFEYYAMFFNRKLHHSVIRIHYWIDILVELPLILCVLSTGIAMAYLVEKLTTPHIIKIGIASMPSRLHWEKPFFNPVKY